MKSIVSLMFLAMVALVVTGCDKGDESATKSGAKSPRALQERRQLFLWKQIFVESAAIVQIVKLAA